MAKRGKQCSICQSDKRHLLELGLVYGIGMRVLAARYEVSKDALQRHQAHMSPAQRAALISHVPATPVDLVALRDGESENLLANVRAQRLRLEQMAEFALTHGDIRGAVSAESGITSNLTLTAKLVGMLVQVHDVRHTNILISADYLKLRSTLIEALRPYPDAARAVGAALHALESEAATDITEAARKPLVIEHRPAPTPQPLGPPPC
jgi:hypothetical protein